jgi:hypothetical protein
MKLNPPVDVFVSKLLSDQHNQHKRHEACLDGSATVEEEQLTKRTFRKQKFTFPCCHVEGMRLDADHNAIFILGKPRPGHSWDNSPSKKFKMFVPPTKEGSVIRFAVPGGSLGYRMILPKGLRVGDAVGISIPTHLLDADTLATLVSKMPKAKISQGDRDPSEDHDSTVSIQADPESTSLGHLPVHTRSVSDYQMPPQKNAKTELDNLDKNDESPNSFPDEKEESAPSLEQLDHQLHEGEEIVYPLDKHGNSIHRYFVKGHWIIHSSTQKVIKWCSPNPLCTKSEPPPEQLRDQHGALIDRTSHLDWLRRHTETHFFKQWSEVSHPLDCIREWQTEHPGTQLVLERANSNGGTLPGYVYNPWMFYDRDMFPELWDEDIS